MSSRLEDVIQRGTRSNQPGATTVPAGTLYFISDELVLERSNGTTWQTYSGSSGGSSSIIQGLPGIDGQDGENRIITINSPIGDFNPEVHSAKITNNPINSDFSWVNQGSSTIIDNISNVVLVGAATGAAANLVLRVKTAPATPYVLTAFLLPLIINKTFLSYGLCFRESSTGKIHTLDIMCTNVAVPLLLRSTKYTDAVTNSADYTIQRMEYLRWFRIADDGANRICSISADGVNFVQFHSIGRTDFLTANQIGFCISTENTLTPNYAPILQVLSWLQT